MIVIQSQNYDISTNDVIEWLLAYKTEFVRINHDGLPIEIATLSLEKEKGVGFSIRVGSTSFRLDDVTAYWHRRGAVPVQLSRQSVKTFLRRYERTTAIAIQNNLLREQGALASFIDAKLAACGRSIGSSGKSVLNKLFVLETAMLCGLDIPETTVSETKKTVQQFAQTNKHIITKAILDNVYVTNSRHTIMFYTEELDAGRIKKMPGKFFPSLFQARVEKKYELRIFYLLGKFYAMAIFSQADSQTAVDFRKYNSETPNRTVPFLLPGAVQQKLHTMMGKLGLKTGSIDMIVTPDERYVFLEVNPVGQFSMLSRPCNFFVEKEIALYLAGKTKPELNVYL